MKKAWMLAAAMVLLLSACAPNFGNQDEELVQQETDETNKKVTIPTYNISDSYYKMVLPFKAGAARGLTAENLNTRLDIDEFETGLMRIAQDSFSTDDYLFQEGQYFDEDTVRSMLGRKLEGKDLEEAKKKDNNFQNAGLNPVKKGSPESSPNYLATMLEHNYLIKKNDKSVELGGVVIGLALNSVYYYRENIGDPQKEVSIDDKKIEEEGKKIAAEVIKRVRSKEELKNVPVTIALYQQAPKTSIVSGDFIAKSEVKAGSTELGSWRGLNEEHAFFPNSANEKKHPDEAEIFNRFKNNVDNYFPNYTGVVGKAFYKDDQLREMKIEIPMQFYGKTEVIAFTQFLTGQIMDYYSANHLRVEVEITSSEGEEAVIVKEEGANEPTVHIYD
ncbi:MULTISPECIES: CamS family sex pheromone protein [Bacillus]|uniref:Calcium ABC transporter ATPase n=2 Tax=Bacillus TaxID=1386 RepID=A0A0M5JCQ1_9BACI|nr:MULTISPECIES: CamS family sex pheromone protein [Bacillus]ALC83919.1 hypothetical protein AM592_22270 [Bacillus gobiensis]MBP1083017.1 protein involved in sex pheromone biosynthesis [Bacillus capparidis]MED1098010.1 CamS family sex pheromone protein [Bacillus capparidis]